MCCELSGGVFQTLNKCTKSRRPPLFIVQSWRQPFFKRDRPDSFMEFWKFYESSNIGIFCDSVKLKFAFVYWTNHKNWANWLGSELSYITMRKVNIFPNLGQFFVSQSIFISFWKGLILMQGNFCHQLWVLKRKEMKKKCIVFITKGSPYN
jgi:hypothetical protein